MAMKEKKCTITTIRRGNVTETVIESDSPRLNAFCKALRGAKAEKLSPYGQHD